MNGFNLVLSSVTPPAGLPHVSRAQEILDLPTYLRVSAATSQSELNLVWISTVAPGPGSGHTDKVWIKIDDTGTARGVYVYNVNGSGAWNQIASQIFIGDLGPTLAFDMQAPWLKTGSTTDSGVTSPGLYLWNGSAWVQIANVGVTVSATAPTSTGIPWLKTDNTTSSEGLYFWDGSAWVLKTAQILAQTATPTGSTGLFWLKTDDVTLPRGLYTWSGSAWVNMTAIAAGGGSGTGATFTQTGSTAPDASIRNYTLWAKTGVAPRGLFWPDATNSRWESIHPITISLRYPDAGTISFPSGVINYTGLAYSIICPTIGSAVFAEIPVMTITVESDSLFGTDFMNFGITPHITPSQVFDIAGYNHNGAARDVALRISATGIMRIPF